MCVGWLFSTPFGGYLVDLVFLVALRIASDPSESSISWWVYWLYQKNTFFQEKTGFQKIHFFYKKHEKKAIVHGPGPVLGPPFWEIWSHFFMIFLRSHFWTTFGPLLESFLTTFGEFLLLILGHVLYVLKVRKWIEIGTERVKDRHNIDEKTLEQFHIQFVQSLQIILPPSLSNTCEQCSPRRTTAARG